MNKSQKQMLIDINNIAIRLDASSREKIHKVAISLLDIKLLEVMPKLSLDELNKLDVNEKIMLIEEYSKCKEIREKEKNESVDFEELLKELGLTLDDLQN